MKTLHIAAACLVLMSGAAPAFAQSAAALPDGQTQAQLASPSAQPISTVIDGRMWACSGASCTAMPSDAQESQSVLRECKRAARQLGSFALYQTGAKTLDGSDLKACNAGAR